MSDGTDQEVVSVTNTDLVPGERLRYHVYNAAGVLLLRRGQVITQKHVDVLLKQGLYFKQKEVETINQDEQNQEANSKKDEELAVNAPFSLIIQVHAQLSKLLSNPQAYPDFPVKIERLARSIITAAGASPDANIAATLLAPISDYPIMHEVQTAMIVATTLSDLAWQKQEIIDTTCAALTMNIAMLDLQRVLFRQAERLSEEQQKLVRVHPLSGSLILQRLGVGSDLWLSAVKHHHELYDGSGYPDKLSGEKIPTSALLIGLVDRFCAKITGREYRDPMGANTALRTLFTDKRREDTRLVAQLIRAVGIYPPGTAVELANGEQGIVTSRGGDAVSQTVRVFFANDGKPLNPMPRRDCRNEQFKIAGVIDAKPILELPNFTLQSLWS